MIENLPSAGVLVMDSPEEFLWRDIHLQHLHIGPLEPVDLCVEGTHAIACVLSDGPVLIEHSRENETRKYCLRRFDMFIAPIGPCGQWQTEDVLEAIVLRFKHDLLVNLAFGAGFAGQVYLSSLQGPIRDDFLRSCLLELKDQVDNRLPTTPVYGDSLAVAIGAHLLSKYGRVVNFSSSRGGDRRLLNVIEYLRNNFTKDISLAELAELANMSPHHFLRIFKSITGLTPHQFLIDYRINMGKKLLLTENLPVKQIAKMVGFCDSGHFSRHFKKITGLSPVRFIRAEESRQAGL